MKVAIVFGLTMLVACGGEVTGTPEDIASRSVGTGSGSAAPGNVACTRGDGGHDGSWAVNASETINGTAYSAKCSCPAATCVCMESSALAHGGGGLAFNGCTEDCSSASGATAFETCGFPH